MRRLALGFLVFFLAVGFLVQPDRSVNADETYPSRQINWYIHSSAGGGTDIFSRTVAMPLRRILKSTIIISTMSGGSGSRMLNHLIEQPADGYTIVSITNSNLGAMARGMTKATMDDLTGIARGCYDPQSFCASTKGRFKSIQEIVDFAKQNPRKVKIGLAHMAGIDHLTAYEFANAAGVQLEYVPFKGGGEIIVALMGGTIDLGVLNPSEFLGQYEADNIKPMVFLVEDRLKDFPDVPTAKELGYDVEMATWRGVAIRSGTPEPFVNTLRDAFLKAMKSKVYQDYLKNNYMGPESVLAGEEWEAFLKKKWPVWQKAMKELGYVKK
jgi:tripartite-type tricarboxylate transporter receptor subunit TctC